MAMRWSRWVATSPPPRTRPPPCTISVSPSALAATPLAISPAAVAASRSLSFTFSSASPSMRVSPARIGSQARQHRVLVDHAGRALRRHAHAAQLGVAHAHVRDRLATLLALIEEGDVGAHLAQRRVEARACRIDQHAFDGDLRARHDQRRRSQEGRRAWIARHRHCAALKLAVTLDGDGARTIALDGGHLGPEMAQHALGVIAGGLRLDDRGRAGSLQPGDQNRRLELRGRHRQAVFDRTQDRWYRAARAAAAVAPVQHLQPPCA